MAKVIYWSWIAASLLLSFKICSLSIPVRSYEFPDTLDYVFSFVFLFGAGIGWSTLFYALRKYHKGMTGTVLFIAIVLLFSYFFRGMYSVATYVLLPFTATLITAFFHYSFAYLLEQKLPGGLTWKSSK